MLQLKKMKQLSLLISFLFFGHISYSQNWDINTLRKINLDRNKSLDESFKVITNSVSPVSIGIPVTIFIIGAIEKDSLKKQTLIVKSLIKQGFYDTLSTKNDSIKLSKAYILPVRKFFLHLFSLGYQVLYLGI